MIESYCFIVIGKTVIKSMEIISHFHTGIGKKVQQTYWVLMLNFHLLAFHTLRNILSNISFHPWLKVLLHGCSNCLLISWVSKIWYFMDFIPDNLPQIFHIQNINFVFKNKNSFIFHKIPFIPLFKILLL